MKVSLLGVNHRTAPIDLRERLTLDPPRCHDLFERLRGHCGVDAVEMVSVSTCNRSELYLATALDDAPAADDLHRLLGHVCGVEAHQVAAAAIHRQQHEAVVHLFRVCAGLDSMVLGETQVLGQVKRSYEEALQRGSVGPVLHRVFQQALAAAKQVRAATGIDVGRLSIGSVAADFARQIFAQFADKTLVVVGAGEMAKLALRHLMDLGPGQVFLANRTAARSQALAQAVQLKPERGGVRAFDDLNALLVEADILVTSTAAPHAVVTLERFRPLQRKRRNRPLFILDLALPRDVEPAVGALTNVYLYNIDDLQQAIDQTHDRRCGQVQQCEALVQAAAAACLAAVQHRDIGHLIRQLRQRLTDLGQAEQERTVRKLLSRNGSGLDPQTLQTAIAQHTTRLINKILHTPLSQLDHRHQDAPLGFYAAALRRLFQLDDPPPPPEAPPPSETHPDALANAAGVGKSENPPEVIPESRSEADHSDIHHVRDG
jgi:glutamyl-tRNA reductase